MWNAMKTKSLAAALLITTTIHGSLLWKMNDVATEAASAMASATVPTGPTSIAAGSATSSPAMRYVTLEPVLVVGRREHLLADQVAPQTTITSSASQEQCMNNSNHPVTLNERRGGAPELC